MLQLGSGQWYTVDFCYGFILSFLFLLDLVPQVMDHGGFELGYLSEVWRVCSFLLTVKGGLILMIGSDLAWWFWYGLPFTGGLQPKM